MNDIYFKKVSALESQKLLFKIINLSDSSIKYLDDGVGLKGKGKEKFNALVIPELIHRVKNIMNMSIKLMDDDSILVSLSSTIWSKLSYIR